MSELKAYKMVDEKYCTDCVCVIPSEVYLKEDVDALLAEKDKMLARHKYKRCLTMAKWCNEKWLVHNFAEIPTKLWFYDKWEKRWMELAEQFKEE